MGLYWLPWLVGMPSETALSICTMIFGGVFERLPMLRVAFAHGGGAFPSIVGRLEHGFNVRPDIVATTNERNPREYIGRFFVDSLVHEPEILKYMIGLLGSDRIALGSDYPFPLGEHHPGKMIEDMQNRGGVWFATMVEIANHVQACIDDGSWKPRVDELPYYDAPIAELTDRALA